jgi:hypothetical protein
MSSSSSSRWATDGAHAPSQVLGSCRCEGAARHPAPTPGRVVGGARPRRSQWRYLVVGAVGRRSAPRPPGGAGATGRLAPARQLGVQTSRVALTSGVALPPAWRRSVPRWRSTRSRSPRSASCFTARDTSDSSRSRRRSPGPPFTSARSSGLNTVTRSDPSRSRARRTSGGSPAPGRARWPGSAPPRARGGRRLPLLPRPHGGRRPWRCSRHASARTTRLVRTHPHQRVVGAHPERRQRRRARPPPRAGSSSPARWHRRPPSAPGRARALRRRSCGSRRATAAGGARRRRPR